MPIPQTPTPASEPDEPLRTGPDPNEAGQESSHPEPPAPRATVATSRWVDYDTHELLDMISELEDERRWSRLREGIWLAVLIHILLISGITWIPRYVLKVPPVIDPFDAIKKRKDLSYLDLPPDILKKYQPTVKVEPVKPKLPPIDRKTLEEMSKPTPPPVPQPETPKLETPAQPQPQPAQPAPKTPSPEEAPRPQAVPARPNFAMGSQNPADQLRDAMRGSAKTPDYGAPQPAGGGMSMHPGAAGGVEILSDRQGVDFNSWLTRWHRETQRTWDPLIPDEVNPPILKSGVVVIRFKVLPNGRIMDGSMKLEGRSGDSGLDRAAWGALTGSNYPPLPREFHGPYLELRAMFLYNMQPPR